MASRMAVTQRSDHLCRSSNCFDNQFHTYLTDEHPLRILIGEIGAGKSLLAERFFQQAAQHALQTDQAPVPVYLSAQDATPGLRSAVLNAADPIEVPATYGTIIIIDGADEVGGVAARAILDEAREGGEERR